MGPTTTRRQMLCAALALAVAEAELAGAPGAAQAATTPPTDGQVLAIILGIELLLVFAYRQALASDVLTGGAGALFHHLLGQEHEHARAISAELTRVGGATPPQEPATIAAADQELVAYRIPGTFTGTHKQRDWLRLMIGIESVAERAYWRAMGTVQDGELLRLCAEIMANEAQHWTLLSMTLHPTEDEVNNWVPSAFVEGA
jgi:Ferritin-like domain